MVLRFGGIYRRLYARFGPQHWWPGDGPFEMMVGAILTQNTNWGNVEKAIANLKVHNVLDPRKLAFLPQARLAALIRSAGYYNIKARRLAAFTRFFLAAYNGSVRGMKRRETGRLRNELLSVEGIGPETADSMLLYAVGKPVFVVDAYTRRVFSRHRLVAPDASYDQIQGAFMSALEPEKKLFNEYHALIVRLAKEFCRKNNPKCKECPLGVYLKKDMVILNPKH